MGAQNQIQTKSVSHPSSAPARAKLLQRQISFIQRDQNTEPLECKEGHGCVLQRAATGPYAVVPPIVHEALNSPGQPLDATTRAFMEPRFGYNFSKVRVHADPRAAESARAVNALAYTVGMDVVLGAGQYAPKTEAGQRLLAHELTHVVQQNNQKEKLQTADRFANELYELEADRVAQRVLQSPGPTFVGPISKSPVALSRQAVGAASSPQSEAIKRMKISEGLEKEANADALVIKSILKEHSVYLRSRYESEIMAIAEKWANRPMNTGAGGRLSSFDYFFIAVHNMTLKVGWIVEQFSSPFDQLFQRMSSGNVSRLKNWMQTRGRVFKNEKPNEPVKFEVTKEDVIRGVKVGGELALAVGTGGGSVLARIGLWLTTELPALYNQAKTILDAIKAIRGMKGDDIRKLISSKGLGELLVSALFGEARGLPALSKEAEIRETGPESKEGQSEKGLMSLLHILVNVIRVLKRTYGRVVEFINKGLSLVNITRYSWFKPFSMAYAAIVNAQKAMESPESSVNQAAAKLREVIGSFFRSLQTRVEDMSGEIKSRINVLGEPARMLRKLADSAVEWILNLLITKGPSEVIKTIFEIYQVASGKSIMEQVRKLPFADKLIKRIADSDTVKKIMQPLEPPIKRLNDAVDRVVGKGSKLIGDVESKALSLMGSGANLVEKLAGAALGTAKGAKLEVATEGERAEEKKAAVTSAPAQSGDFLGVVKHGIHTRLLAIGEMSLLEKGRSALKKGAAAGKTIAKKIKGILLGSIIDFNIGREHHRLWAEAQDGQVTVFVESDEESIEDKIDRYRKAIRRFLKDPQIKGKSNEFINQLKDLNDKIESSGIKNPRALKNYELKMASILGQIEELIKPLLRQKETHEEFEERAQIEPTEYAEDLTTRTKKSETRRHRDEFEDIEGRPRYAKHHGFPKYLGGRYYQELLKLKVAIHYLYHEELDKVVKIPRKLSSNYYRRLSKSKMQEILKKVIDHSEKFDKKHGTKIKDALIIGIEEAQPLAGRK